MRLNANPGRKRFLLITLCFTRRDNADALVALVAGRRLTIAETNSLKLVRNWASRLLAFGGIGASRGKLPLAGSLFRSEYAPVSGSAGAFILITHSH